MSNAQTLTLNLLANGRISASEAEILLRSFRNEQEYVQPARKEINHNMFSIDYSDAYFSMPAIHGNQIDFLKPF